MGAKLKTESTQDLYGFWGDKLARALEPKDGPVVDLASREYSRAVVPHLPHSVPLVTCIFGRLRTDGRVVEQGAPCKMARGQMVRWMAERAVTRVEELREFQDLGYCFSPEHSDPGRYVFLKEDDT